MANHFHELECEACGKACRISWYQPLQSSLIEVNPLTISHCPLERSMPIVAITSSEELLDGQWVSVEPYVHRRTNVEAA